MSLTRAQLLAAAVVVEGRSPHCKHLATALYEAADEAPAPPPETPDEGTTDAHDHPRA